MVNFAIIHSIHDNLFKLDDVDFVAKSISIRPGQLDDTSRNGGLSLLHKAAMHNATKCVKLLLESGMDVNYASSKDGSNDALGYAVLNNADSEIMTMLIDAIKATGNLDRLKNIYVEFITFGRLQSNLTERFLLLDRLGLHPKNASLGMFDFDGLENFRDEFIAFRENRLLQDDAHAVLAEKPLIHRGKRL